jgi:hypothetical protein
MKNGCERIFDDADKFILKNWRSGLCLSALPPREAVEKIRERKDVASKATISAAWYDVRRKRLGLLAYRKTATLSGTVFNPVGK